MGSCISTGPNASTHTEHRQLWQDRQIRWDQPKSSVMPRSGEVVIKRFDNIEDTKGENGLGSLTVTNLRLIWTANHNPKLNISIGLGNVSYIHFNMTDSPTFGRTRAPQMMTQLSNSKFEFTFASRHDIAIPLFNELDVSHRRYRATRMFRDLVLRDEYLMKNGEAVIYHGESLLKQIPGCENLTTDEKFPGVMFITDRAVGVRMSNFGSALVIETSQVTGGYILGFKFPNSAVLSEAQSLLNSNFHNRKSAPYFGPMDGIVQYMDDRLVVVAEASTSDTLSLSQIDPQQLPMSPYTPSITARRYSSRLLPEPLDSTVQQQSRPTGNQNDDGGRELNGDQNEEREQSLTLMSESSSPETVSTPSLRIDSISTTMSLRNPINIHHVDPLPIDLEHGQASVVYSGANQIATNQAELLLSISPSSRKYHAPRCVVCMATPTEVLVHSTRVPYCRAPYCRISYLSCQAAFDPCGHLCSCMNCAAKLKYCPVNNIE